MKYTVHFEDDEIEAPPELELHGVLLACALEEVRAVVGAAVHVICAYRDSAHNAEVGGAPTSYHLFALAADVYMMDGPRAVPLDEAMALLRAAECRLPLVRRIIEDRRPGHEHIHIEARHPERDDGAPLQYEIETAVGFRPWRIS